MNAESSDEKKKPNHLICFTFVYNRKKKKLGKHAIMPDTNKPINENRKKKHRTIKNPKVTPFASFWSEK